MSLNPICSTADFNVALDAIFSRTSSTPEQREAISKKLEFLQERLDFLLYKGTEIQITDLAACQMRLDGARRAFERGILPLGSSTALALSNPPQVAAPVQAAPSITLPAECMVLVFSRAIKNTSEPIVLGTLSLVCKGWQELASNDFLWEPIFNRYIENTTYDIYYSSAQKFRDKVVLLNKTTLTDFEKTILECVKEKSSTSIDSIKILIKSIKHIKSEHLKSIHKDLPDLIKISSEEELECAYNQIGLNKEQTLKNNVETELAILGSRRFLNEHDLTSLIIFLIDSKNLESIAKLLLFKPKIDAGKILTRLTVEKTNPSSLHVANDYIFIAQLMVKLGYKETSYVTRSLITSNILTSFSQLKVNGLKLSDYVANGNFFLPVASIDLIFLDIMKKCYQLFYSTGTFASPTHPNDSDPVSFSDEKLQKHIRKGPFSEDDLKELILDLLTKVGFNLDEIYPERDSLKEGTLLSQFRQLVDTLPLPKPNALSKALAKYDQMQAEKL